MAVGDWHTEITAVDSSFVPLAGTTWMMVCSGSVGGVGIVMTDGVTPTEIIDVELDNTNAFQDKNWKIIVTNSIYFTWAYLGGADRAYGAFVQLA